MEPGIPTSFIPKRPVSSEPETTHSSNRTVGILSLMASVFVIATIIAFVGVYMYGSQLKGKKAKLQESITDARDGLGTDFVEDMRRLNARIDGVEALIKTHVVVSPIFEALQKTTLRSIQYTNFGYTTVTDASTKTQNVEVKLSGTAVSYATIALQSEAFARNSLIRNPVFSGLSIDEKTERVNFLLTFNVSPADLSYQKFIGATEVKATTP